MNLNTRIFPRNNFHLQTIAPSPIIITLTLHLIELENPQILLIKKN